MTIKIEKGIPLPTTARTPRAEKYPLRQLEVGDSFVAPVGQAALSAHARRVAKDTGYKFVVRHAEGGARVWRKA